MNHQIEFKKFQIKKNRHMLMIKLNEGVVGGKFKLRNNWKFS